jgi:hypothetical protein
MGFADRLDVSVRVQKTIPQRLEFDMPRGLRAYL